jgi:hypothetical protein
MGVDGIEDGFGQLLRFQQTAELEQGRGMRLLSGGNKPQRKTPPSETQSGVFVQQFPGGDGGIRTLDPRFSADAPLAGECLRPLGHVS